MVQKALQKACQLPRQVRVVLAEGSLVRVQNCLQGLVTLRRAAPLGWYPAHCHAPSALPLLSCLRMGPVATAW